MTEYLIILAELTGIITHGGVTPNIIPDYTELEYYFRAPSKKRAGPIERENASVF